MQHLSRCLKQSLQATISSSAAEPTLATAAKMLTASPPKRCFLNENRKLAKTGAQQNRGQTVKKQKTPQQQREESLAKNQEQQQMVVDAEPVKDELSQSEKVRIILKNKEKIKEQAKKNRAAAGLSDSDDSDAEDQVQRKTSIFEYDIDCVELKKKDMLEKYPWAAEQIENALYSPDKLPRIKKKRAEQLLNADKFLQAFSVKGSNMSFEEQKALRKVLVEPAEDGEETDYESDQEGLETREQQSYDQRQQRQSAKMEEKSRGIFRYLSVIDTKVNLPPMKPIFKEAKPHGGLTLYLELDDVLLHTFICDENTGYIAKPTFKDPEYEFMLKEVRLPILVYERDHMEDFMKYLMDAKSEIETVVFTRAERIYVDGLLKHIDPERKVFDHVLTQNACYRLVKKDDDIDHFLKDISRFKNRRLERSVLADPDMLNFALTPENGLPVMPYKGENFLDSEEKDTYLLTLIDEIEELRKMDDVRPYLDQQYGHRQLLKNAKLI